MQLVSTQFGKLEIDLDPQDTNFDTLTGTESGNFRLGGNELAEENCSSFHLISRIGTNAIGDFWK